MLIVGVLSVLVVVLGAAAQGVTGMGFGLITAPVLIGLYGPLEGVRQVVLLSLLLNLIFLFQGVRQVLLKEALALLLPALIIAPVLSSVIRRAEPHLLLIIAGTLTVSSAALLTFGLRLRSLNGIWGAIGAGVTSSAMNLIGGLAGPAAAMYAVNAAWPTVSVRPTL